MSKGNFKKFQVKEKKRYLNSKSIKAVLKLAEHYKLNLATVAKSKKSMLT